MSKKHGFGRYEWIDGSYYQGQFKQGEFHGTGVYYFADIGKTYTGEFKNANMHGFGREEWLNGQIFVGQFRKGKRHGEGTMTYVNQKQYKGEWVQNMRHGTGVEINLKVKTYRVGEWKKDKWMRWLSAT